jgi:iron complex outermembrane receptor protein
MDVQRSSNSRVMTMLLGIGTVIACPANVTPPTQLDEFFVTGQRIAALSVAVPRGELQPPAPNYGAELLTIPGVYGHSRAVDAMEPNIRGLSFDRVATTLNGLVLVNASPERTNSPVVILGASGITDITVLKALPSVTLGPATTGGRIALTTDSGAAGKPFTGQFTSVYDGGRRGVTSTAAVAARAGEWDATATIFQNDLNDYAAPDGRTVAARFHDHGGSASLGRTTANQRTRVEVLTRRLQREDTVALPLDGRNTEARVVTFNHRWNSPFPGPLDAIVVRAGYATTDPYITSEDRVSPRITAQATARSASGGLHTIWSGGDRDTLALGGDLARQTRRAVRTTASGRDYIWPKASYTDAGVFAEWMRQIGERTKVRFGARWDDVRSDAADADQPALGHPIREQYATYNGANAAVTRRHDQAGATNLLVTWRATPEITAFAGAGYSVQPAAVMERYRAFLNALGGDGRGGNAFELGNPSLKSERKIAVEAGVTWHHPRFDAEAACYAYRIDDFIWRTPVGFASVGTSRQVVFGYRNTNAAFYGAELALMLKPADRWTIPLSLAVAEGENRNTGTGLAEIPPVEARAGIRHSTSAWNRPVALEIGGRIAGAKSNPVPLDNPLFVHTGGFSVWHLRGRISLSPHLRLQAGVENLLNRSYTEYLSPPVAPIRPASGSLHPGERIPAPRRSGWLAMTLTW